MKVSENTFSSVATFIGVWLGISLLFSGIAYILSDGILDALLSGFKWGSILALVALLALAAFVGFNAVIAIPVFIYLYITEYFRDKFVAADYNNLPPGDIIRKAKRGDVEAQNRLGVRYETGNGVPQNMEEAIKWYRKAAAKGDLWANRNLAVLYECGRGLERDSVKAAYHYTVAADGGLADAQCNLGRLYRDGIGVTQNTEKARELFRLAAAQGLQDAAQLLQALDQPVPVPAAAQTHDSAVLPAAVAATGNNLDSLIGLQSVKNELKKIEKYIHFERERAEKIGANAAEKARYNFLFTGNPGTGKTTVARCLAEMLYKAGAIEENKLVEASRSDLVGKWQGHTAQQTQEVVERALGGVLFIDEAYALVQGDGDTFGKEALDTLVKLIEDHKDRLAVIFAGYAKETEELLQQNTGLKSRFNRRIDFPDYSEDELLLIARQIATKRAYTMSAGAERAFREAMAREKLKPGFANARTAAELMQAAFERHALHAEEEMARNPDYLHTLTEADFGVRFDEQENQTLDALRAQLDALIGLGSVKTAVRKQIARLDFLRQEANAAGKPFDVGNERLHLCFTGGPGTGKTTVARLYAQILKSLGVLASGHVVEATRADLVAAYMGQSAPKTRQLCQSAYGGVLFIDEAYSLFHGAQDEFGKEAIGELIVQMENERRRLVVILAGYNREMQEFFSANSGIRSRIGQTIEFPDYSADELWQIFQRAMQGGSLPLTASEEVQQLIQQKIRQMHAARDANFGNAREMEKLLAAIRDSLMLRVSEGGITGEARYRITPEDVEHCSI